MSSFFRPAIRDTRLLAAFIHPSTALDMLKEHHRQVKTGKYGEQPRETMVYSNEWLDERGTPDDGRNFAMTTR